MPTDHKKRNFFKLRISNFITNHKQTFLLLIFSALILFPTIKSLVHPGFFRVDDDIQTMRVLEMTKCLKDFQIPCRWVPDMGFGYGYPQFIYYGPLPYYLMSIGHLLGLSILGIIKLFFGLSIVLAFFSFYYLARRFVSPLSAFFGAFLYTYAPYKITNIFNRGALGEFTAWIFIPLILAFIYDLARNKNRSKNWLYLVLAGAGLITTHNLSLILYAPVILVLSFYWLTQSPVKKIFLKNIITAGLASLAVTAWFWLPMLFYQNQVHIETMFWGYFNYLAHFLSLKEILFVRFWDWGDSQLGLWDRMTLSLGLWAWVLSTLTLIFVWLKKQSQRYLITYLYLLLWALLFLSHSKSTFIYQALPFLQKLQFPWRWLSPAVFLTAFIASFFIDSLKPALRKTWVIVLVVVIMLNYGFWFRFESWQNFTDKTKFTGKSWQQQQTISIFDYLPKSAKHPPTKASPEKPYFITGQGRVVNFNRRTNSWQIKLNITSPKAILEVPNFYYPGWTVVESGRKLDFNYDNELGLIRIPLDKGPHNIMVKMKPTLLFKLADTISLAGLAYILIASTSILGLVKNYKLKALNS
ncbi:MAG: hypothetical protein GXP43_02350 [bacterium]|nr:hypothetical protein [bacterium]